MVERVIFLLIEILITFGTIFGFQLISDYYVTTRSGPDVWIGNMDNWLQIAAIIYFGIVGIGLLLVEKLYFAGTLQLLNIKIMAILLLVFFLNWKIATSVFVLSLIGYMAFFGTQQYVLVYCSIFTLLFALVLGINAHKEFSFAQKLVGFLINSVLFWVAVALYRNVDESQTATSSFIVFNSVDMIVLVTITSLAVRFLEQNQLMIFEQTQAASVDELTKLYTYHAFTVSFERMYQSAAKRNTGMCLEIMDLDNFKHLNDTYGHLAGNYVLTSFGAILNRVCAREKMAAAYRIGGEETAILFDTDDLDQANRILQACQAEVERFEFKYKQQIINLTFSAGIGMSRGSEFSSRSFFDQVDHATYNSKHLGGNLITIADVSEEQIPVS